MHRHPEHSPVRASIGVVLALFLSLLAQPALADIDDRTKPINIKADRSEFDQRQGRQTFSGNVEVSQGSMAITADRVVIEIRDGAFYRITGVGSPIQFQQLGKNSELIRGQSGKIAYDTSSSQLTFEGDAQFERPGQKFSGETIRYNMRDLTFEATGSDKGRVSIVLQPGKPKQ